MSSKNNDEQLSLSFNRTGDLLRDCLEQGIGRPVALVLTGNATSMLSVRIRDNHVHMRLHAMFLAAPQEVIGEIIAFVKHRKKSMRLFRRFVRENAEILTRKKPNRVTAKTKGTFFDLKELYDEINGEYFGNSIDAAITWGTNASPCGAKKRTLGSYSERSHTIRINPVLDKKKVPRYYIAFVVYHEMLHAALGIARNGKRRSVHGREFRDREKTYKDYERAAAWEAS